MCLAVQFANQTSDGWHGSLNLKAPKDLNGVQIDVMFDEFVPAFAVKLFHPFYSNFKCFFSVNFRTILVKLHQRIIAFSPSITTTKI